MGSHSLNILVVACVIKKAEMDGNCLEWGKSKFWFWCRAAKA
jgi:hypothetical protein